MKKMRTDKQAAKGTGGFFNLFDWNVKSRKKLFSSKSDLPERLKQGKKSDVNLPMTRLHLMDDNETGAGSSNKGSSDYSCGSSVTDDDGYGTKAPGVVARLMGLDSLPTSNAIEPYSSPFFDPQSIKDSHHLRKNYDVHHDHQLLHSGNLAYKVEGPARKIMESKPPRFSNRPIEKFQTEVLPPKSAKSIPITQHKMLSPIKNSGFIPAKNAAHIMEAAAKIIDQGSQTTTRAKVSHAVPSVTLKTRDLKVKLEAPSRASRLGETSRRHAESNSAKYLKGQSLNKSWNGSVDTSFQVFNDADENSDNLKTKGKSISLAIQAKVNVQRREGLNQCSVGQREQDESNSSQSFSSRPNIQKNINKCSTRDTTAVLRPNDQKQNCLDKDRVSAKPSVSNWQTRKAVSRESSVGRNKNVSKITSTYKGGSKKLGVEVTASDRGVSYSKAKSLNRKKRSVDEDFQFLKNHVVDNSLVNNGENQFNPGTDGRFKWAEESRKKGMDIVSFTFTAPMTRPISGTESTNREAAKNNGFFSEYEGKNKLGEKDRTKLSSFGLNVIGSNDLSVLLEQKLMELTSGNRSSQSNSTAVGKSTSHLHDMVPRLHDKRDYLGYRVDKLGNRFDYNLSSIESSKCQTRHKFQGMEEMSEHSEGPVDARHPSPISILEPITTESCNSSDSAVSHSTEGSRHCSSVQAQEVVDLGSSKKFRLVESDTELSDSASSTSARKMAWETAFPFTTKDHARSTEWELAYVEEILCNVELMFKDFTLGRAREIVNPHLFYKLENRKGGLLNGDGSRIRRKELFDGVSECLDLKCRRYVGGGCGLWAEGLAMVKRNKWLAQEVYREICGWRRMCDRIVDELVDKDMSSQHGRWLDFEVEAFVVGADIQDQILRSLVDEVVADFLYF